MIRYRFPLLIFLFNILLFSDSLAQRPFDCNGRIFRVKGERKGTLFQEFRIQKNPTKVEMDSLSFFEDTNINGISYRTQDNFIYGVELTDGYQLIRIDGNYELSFLRDLPIPEEVYFVAGDISPDGQHLVLLGFGKDDEYGNLLVMVDLTQEDYPLQIIPLATTGETPTIHCADIAFHPTTGILYGFDHRLDKLITIDINTRTIDNNSLPKAGAVKGNMPSIFFDAYGQLFGIAYPNDNSRYRSIYQFDPASGIAKEIQKLGDEDNQDACSCPYQVNLQNEVSSRSASTCTELDFTLTFINRSPFIQKNLKLRDTFPPGMTIKSIEDNPFEGRFISGVGSNILALDGINLPIGEQTMKVVLSIDQSTPKRVYRNQAYLYNVIIREEEERVSRLSDDPQTPKALDPTVFEVKGLELVFEEDFPNICEGESVELNPGVAGALKYEWSNGETKPSITVEKEGFYEITVTTSCETQSAGIYVDKDQVSVRFPEVIKVEEGVEVLLTPKIQSNSPIKYYYWKSNRDSISLGCLSCESITAEAISGLDYELLVENESGCTASASVQFEFQAFQFYVPNAFSPDNDGINDRFFPFGKSDFKIMSFQVFDRWGGLLYEVGDCKANDPIVGWDGTENGELLDAGIYIWSVKLETAGGKMIQNAGEVHLFR